MLFLLNGEVDVLSDLDGLTPVRRITTHEDMLLDEISAAPLASLSGTGCFGQEALVGLRRRSTAVARTFVETLIIEKADLLQLFKGGQAASDLRRICNAVLSTFMGLERLRNLGTALRFDAAGRAGLDGKHLRAQLLMKLAWRRYEQRYSQQDELRCLIKNTRQQTRESAARRSTSSVSDMAPSPGPDGFLMARKLEQLEANQRSLQASLVEVQSSLSAIGGL